MGHRASQVAGEGILGKSSGRRRACAPGKRGYTGRRPWLKAPGDGAGLFVAPGTSTRREAGKPTALACRTMWTCSVWTLPSAPSSLKCTLHPSPSRPHHEIRR
ncbi:hypothetical protein VTO73DRAFT_12827 [Trametes versicolor]